MYATSFFLLGKYQYIIDVILEKTRTVTHLDFSMGIGHSTLREHFILVRHS